jgi:LAO/AO transport system kinase
VQEILPFSGKSIRIGVTGVPGVGKSTFIEAFGKYLINIGHKVAVLSIDPSSQRSKGSILGDKTRMEELANLEEAFIRPSSSGDTLGGVTNKTNESILLCEAAGYDIILIETVGVGQSETAVHAMTDFFLLLMLTGAGDELQGIKKGIMEMADMIVINKADGDNIQMSNLAKLQYQNVLHIFPKSESGWDPIVGTASSTENIGIENVWIQVEKYIKLVKKNNYFKLNRNSQQIEWMFNNINEEIKYMFYNSEIVKSKLVDIKKNVSQSKLSPANAAQEIIEEYKKHIK